MGAGFSTSGLGESWKEFEQGTISVPSGENSWAVLYLRSAKAPDIQLDLKDTPKAQVDIELVCSVLQYIGDTADVKWKGDLQDISQRYIEQELQRVFGICMGLGSDAMGFGRRAAMQFSDTAAWEGYGWKERYPDMQAEFTVKLELMDESMSGRLE